MDADLVVVAGTMHTLEADGSATAVAVKDGLVAGLGDRKQISGWSGPHTRVLDLGPAATVTPGLTDGHVHPVMGTRMTEGVSLLGVRSVSGLRAALAEHVASLPEGAWVLAWGLQPQVFGDSEPHYELVETAVGGRPTVIRYFDGHAALASRAALERAGVDGPREFADNSTIVCDAAGRPTGVLCEGGAMSTVLGVIPERPAQEEAVRVRESLLGMARSGITSAHAMEFFDGSDEIYRAIEADGSLPVRLRCFAWCMPGGGPEQWQKLVDLQGERGRRWSMGGVKLFIDGTVDHGTAWLHTPDARGTSVEPAWPDPEEYRAAVAFFHARGVATATHAIGDRAVEYALEVLEAAGAGPGGVRHRIEHVETLRTEAIKQFATLGVIASMQPTHCTDYVQADGSDNWSVRLGPERAARGWRLADLNTAGVPLVLGSDWPIADHDPRGILAAAQLRRPGALPTRTPVSPGQAIDARTALAGYTTRSAWAVGEENIAGSLAVGKRADLAAFSADPLRSSPDELAECAVLATVVGGEVVHEA
ncbi:amidohydrolase [Streptomyces inhibens]|uniref:amidohydrolase n=1 Tax=Streptomyces inhibens TaxID=2293571 RepID=UPI0036970535